MALALCNFRAWLPFYIIILSMAMAMTLEFSDLCFTVSVGGFIITIIIIIIIPSYYSIQYFSLPLHNFMLDFMFKTYWSVLTGEFLF